MSLAELMEEPLVRKVKPQPVRLMRGTPEFKRSIKGKWRVEGRVELSAYFTIFLEKNGYVLV